MAEELRGNCLVAQSGGPTAVINASLAGVVSEALNYDCIEEIYGGLNGMMGVLQEDFIDLAAESQQHIRGLRYTPGAALGASRYKMKKAADFERLIKVFMAQNIRYFYYIGGNDSMEAADRIGEMAKEKGYEMRILGLPKTVDNDLVMTDHTPGYGSVIKYACTVVKEIACDNESMGQGDLVSILEVMGRNSGWIAAGTTLAKRRDQPSDAPHLVYLPEVQFDAGKFVNDVKRVLASQKYCFVVVGEGLVDKDGNYLATTSSKTDAFGHAQLGGVGDYLSRLVDEQLGIKVRACRLGHGQRAASHCSSQTDNDEAFMVGQAAVRAAVKEGVTGKMVTLVRGDSEHYVCETGLTDLKEVANGVKNIPPNWINEDGVSMNFQFHKYAYPLIQGEVKVPYDSGVPNFIHLSKIRIDKKLSPHVFE